MGDWPASIGIHIMRRAFLSLLGTCLLFLATQAVAQLTIEITGGGANQIPVAVLNFPGEEQLPSSITDIVEADLQAALASGKVKGAALDVYPVEPPPTDTPYFQNANVILTPHTSGFRPGHWDEVVDVFADNLTRWRSGRDVRFRIQPELGY